MNRLSDKERVLKMMDKFSKQDLWWVAKKLDAVEHYIFNIYSCATSRQIASGIVSRVRDCRGYALTALDKAILEASLTTVFANRIIKDIR